MSAFAMSAAASGSHTWDYQVVLVSRRRQIAAPRPKQTPFMSHRKGQEDHRPVVLDMSAQVSTTYIPARSRGSAPMMIGGIIICGQAIRSTQPCDWPVPAGLADRHGCDLAQQLRVLKVTTKPPSNRHTGTKKLGQPGHFSLCCCWLDWCRRHLLSL